LPGDITVIKLRSTQFVDASECELKLRRLIQIIDHQFKNYQKSLA
jgi:hypothetical protein